MKIAEILPVASVQFANRQKNRQVVLRFEKAQKMYMPPKTQIRLLKMQLDKSEENWIGKQVTLHAALDKNPGCGGEKAPCIRIRATIDIGLIPGGIRAHMGEDLTGRRLVKL